MATLKENIIRAVKERNVTNLTRIVDKLRFKNKATYAEIKGIFQRCAGTTSAQFEALMYECDYDYQG